MVARAAANHQPTTECGLMLLQGQLLGAQGRQEFESLKKSPSEPTGRAASTAPNRGGVHPDGRSATTRRQKRHRRPRPSLPTGSCFALQTPRRALPRQGAPFPWPASSPEAAEQTAVAQARANKWRGDWLPVQISPNTGAAGQYSTRCCCLRNGSSA